MRTCPSIVALSGFSLCFTHFLYIFLYISYIFRGDVKVIYNSIVWAGRLYHRYHWRWDIIVRPLSVWYQREVFSITFPQCYARSTQYQDVNYVNRSRTSSARDWIVRVTVDPVTDIFVLSIKWFIVARVHSTAYQCAIIASIDPGSGRLILPHPTV